MLSGTQSPPTNMTKTNRQVTWLTPIIRIDRKRVDICSIHLSSFFQCFHRLLYPRLTTLIHEARSSALSPTPATVTATARRWTDVKRSGETRVVGIFSVLSLYSNAFLTRYWYAMCSSPGLSPWLVLAHALTNWTRQRRAVCLCVSCILWKPYQKVSDQGLHTIFRHTHQSDNIPWFSWI